VSLRRSGATEACLRRQAILKTGLLGVIFSLALSFLVFAADSVLENDPKELDSAARYNYFVGQSLYNQGRFSDAQQYFQRSRDMIQRKKEIVSHEERFSPDQLNVTPAASATSGGFEYKVGEGDILFSAVWENDDLNQEAVVRPDGKISLPLIGDVQAGGRAIAEITADVTARLKEYLKYPQVSISIRKLGGSKVIVLGQVNRPGVYAVSGSRTLLEAIALAGGFTSDAVVNSIVLIRGGLQHPKATRLNLKTLMKGVKFDGNIALQSEDIIFVPKTFISDLNYVLMTIIDPVSRGGMTVDFMQKWHR
jgi:polysaccharide export outer membrane protein